MTNGKGEVVVIGPAMKALIGFMSAIITAGSVAAVGGLWVAIVDGAVLSERVSTNARDIQQIRENAVNSATLLSALQAQIAVNQASLSELRTIAREVQKDIDEATQHRKEIERRTRSNEISLSPRMEAIE